MELQSALPLLATTVTFHAVMSDGREGRRAGVRANICVAISSGAVSPSNALLAIDLVERWETPERVHESGRETILSAAKYQAFDG